MAVRLAAFYAAYFLVTGAHLPFWPVWLSAHGLSAWEIGVLSAVAVGTKVIVAPLVGDRADRVGERRRPMLILSALSFAAFALFQMTHSFWTILAVSVLFFAAWPPIMPLGESLTMLAVRPFSHVYGRIRLWGSLSFIVAAVLAGAILTHATPDSIFWFVLIAVGLTVAACWWLPDARADPSQGSRRAAVSSLLTRRFSLFLAGTALIQASHAVYYAFGTLHWRQAGYSADLIGGLWAEGVVAEIILFAFAPAVLRRVPPVPLVVIGGIFAAIRWTVTGATDDLTALILVQALHAFSFGATHLGAIHYLTDTVPPSLSATAQSLYSAVVMGAVMGPMLLASGALYGAFGAGAFFAMAIAAALGAVLVFIAHPRTSVGDGR